jgi:hypothetical protein
LGVPIRVPDWGSRYASQIGVPIRVPNELFIKVWVPGVVSGWGVYTGVDTRPNLGVDTRPNLGGSGYASQLGGVYSYVLCRIVYFYGFV